LDSICKIYKRNKKTEKEKKKRKKKKTLKGPGDLNRPSFRNQPTAQLDKSPNRYAALASPSLTSGSHASGDVSVFFLQPKRTPETKPEE
jgi:hypothetical protein